MGLLHSFRIIALGACLIIVGLHQSVEAQPVRSKKVSAERLASQPERYQLLTVRRGYRLCIKNKRGRILVKRVVRIRNNGAVLHSPLRRKTSRLVRRLKAQCQAQFIGAGPVPPPPTPEGPPTSSGPGSLDPTFGVEGRAYVGDRQFSWLPLGDKRVVGFKARSIPGQVSVTLSYQPENLSSTSVHILPLAATLSDIRMHILYDGSYLLQGRLDYPAPHFGNSNDVYLLRLTPAGEPFTGFGTNGVVLIDHAARTKALLEGIYGGPLPLFSAGEYPYGIAIDSDRGADGSIAITGTVSNSEEGDISFITRLNLAGRPIESFGDAGTVLLRGYRYRHQLVLESDGAMTLLGYLPGKDPSNGKFIPGLFRFTPGGELDVTFGQDGQVVHDFSNGVLNHDDVALHRGPGDTVVISAEVRPTSNGGDIFAARVKRDGSLDSQFGNAGTVILDLGANERLSPYSVAVTTEGEIAYGVNQRSTSGDRGVLVLLDVNGNLVPDFAASGILTLFTPVGNPSNVALTEVVLMPGRQLGVFGHADGREEFVLVNLD